MLSCHDKLFLVFCTIATSILVLKMDFHDFIRAHAAILDFYLDAHAFTEVSLSKRQLLIDHQCFVF